ncbi:MAG TPA: cytidylate kinase-like family protein, partial [Actinomycetota bacterium]|nr:cytidylate kinase-like family protein [Actinomycetota bacterium]
VAVVTVSRQYGAGGLRVAPRLAEILGLRFVDREIVEEAARRIGVDPEVARGLDERAPALIEEVGLALAAGTPELGATPRPDERSLAEAVEVVIRSLADAGGFVILGRGGQAILADRPDACHVALVGTLEDRAARIAASQGIDPRDARQRCERMDAERAGWVQRFHGVDVDDPLRYHAVLNTSRLGIDRAVDVAAEVVRRTLGT